MNRLRLLSISTAPFDTPFVISLRFGSPERNGVKTKSSGPLRELGMPENLYFYEY